MCRLALLQPPAMAVLPVQMAQALPASMVQVLAPLAKVAGSAKQVILHASGVATVERLAQAAKAVPVAAAELAVPAVKAAQLATAHRA